MNKICVICGENLYKYEDEVKKEINRVLLDLIENKGVDKFYSTRMSNFDIMCEECVRELKKTHKDIKLYFIYPYESTAILKKMDYYKKIYDNVSEFNEYSNDNDDLSITYMDQMYMWLTNITDYIITYLQRDRGRVYNVLKYADENVNVIFLTAYGTAPMLFCSILNT